jgi:hypothetical protein
MLRVSGFRNPKRKRGTESRRRLTMQNGPSLTLRVVKNQAKRHPDRFEASNNATSKSVKSPSLALRVSVVPNFLANLSSLLELTGLQSQLAIELGDTSP